MFDATSRARHLMPSSFLLTWRNSLLTWLGILLYANSFSIRLPRINLHRPSGLRAAPFWQDGLHFGCTGCGKCCKNEGDVFFSIDEFSDLAARMKVPAETVLEQYADKVIGDWGKMKSVASPKSSLFPAQQPAVGDEQCVFLEEDGRTCGVYESRPVQCRTFPYWPSLLQNKDAWDGAGPSAAKTDDQGVGRGSNSVEGIDHAHAPLVPPATIHQNSQLYNAYISAFLSRTASSARGQADERGRLLLKLEVMGEVAASTKLWVRDFVLRHGLCPFAVSVFHKDQVRYRVCLETDRSKIIDRVKFEALDLLQHEESDVATTLLMLPFAFPEFMDFHEFSLDMEDVVMPAFEKQTIANPRPTQTKEVQAPIPIEVQEPEIQLAFFHHRFSWAPPPPECPYQSHMGNSDGTQMYADSLPAAVGDNALDFEKRAPFPTINLLRARTVKMYANEDVTKKIATNNEKALRSAGAGELSKQFETFILQDNN